MPRDTEIDRRTYVKGAAALGAAGLSGLSGCLAGDGDGAGDDIPDEPEEDETLEIVHWWTAGGEEEALNALIEGFLEEHDYSRDERINNNPAPGGAGSAIDAAIQSRVIDEQPPSTFQIWPGESLTPYTEADALRTIDGVWTDEMQDAYLDGVIETARPEGDLVAVPLNIHRLNQVFYNVDVLEDAGVDPSSLSSPTDLLDAMQAADEAGYTGMAHQTQAVWSTLQLWETVFIAQHGVDAFTDFLEGNVGDHESEIQESLQLVVDYREYFSPDASSIAWDQANAQVIDGDAAFIHQGDWAAGQYNAADFEYGDGWDYVPFPGSEGVYSLVMDSFTFPEPNPSPTLTQQFLQYCGSVDGQRRFNPIKGSIPPRTDVPTDDFPPFLQDQMDDFSNSEDQPPTIAHGTGLNPEDKSTMEEIFSGFIDDWDAEETTGEIVDQL